MAVGSVLAAGCSGDSSGPATAPTVTPTSETPLDEDGPVEDEPVFGEGDQSTSGPGDEVGLSPTGMRFGVHEDFDRLVIDFEGEGEPTWTAEYTDTPTEVGSGDTFDVTGESVLEVTITGAALPTEEEAVDWSGAAGIIPQSSGVIEQATRGALFEGNQQLFIGVSSAEDFRVFALEDPTRLVVDVFHP
ncbi:AMIN-like domain-containing (lipo)protein [Demequina sp. SO4-18]|uniref:AMIN-like domain-containing (lipo)protein n=1 Tax=Demequina sp. SO4-18 TaxID=3401026 RepID=UPI003B5C802C